MNSSLTASPTAENTLSISLKCDFGNLDLVICGNGGTTEDL